jgi:hypothetical protein
MSFCNNKQKKLYSKLKQKYSDNHQFENELKEALVKLEYLKRSSNSTRDNFGSIIENNIEYSTTTEGESAISNGRFRSETKDSMIAKRSLWIGRIAAIIGIIGASLGVLSALGLLQVIVSFF